YTVLLLLIVALFLFFFFFSSRRRHTRSYGDWSSDVCSSDLCTSRPKRRAASCLTSMLSTPCCSAARWRCTSPRHPILKARWRARSEERRVGKEGRSRWSPDD